MHKKNGPARGRIAVCLAFAAVLILMTTSVAAAAATQDSPNYAWFDYHGIHYENDIDDGTVKAMWPMENMDSVTIPDIAYDGKGNGYKVTVVRSNFYSKFSTQPTGTLTLGSNLQIIEDSAFFNCEFTGKLIMPASLKEVRYEALFHSNFSSVTILGGDFENLVFQSMSELKEIFIADGVKITEYTFTNLTFHDRRILTPEEIPEKYYTVSGTSANKVYDRYTVSFDTDGGTPIPETQYIDSGKKIDKPAGPEKEGMSFSHWEINGTKVEFPYTVTDSVMLKAIFVYMLSFDLQGGTGTFEPINTIGEITLSSDKPFKEGYTFLGWDEDSTVTEPGYQPGSTYNITKNATLYAIWGGTVTFNPMGGTVDPTTIIGKGEKTLPTPTSSSPLPFRGWNDGSTTYTSTYSITKDVTLYAIWGEPSPDETCILSFDLNGGDGSIAVMKIIKGKEATLPGGQSKVGYTFAGWGCGGTTYEAGHHFDAVESDMHFKAVWTPIQYTVTFVVPEGVEKPADTSVDYDSTYGELPTATRTGYTFVGWYTMETGGDLVTPTTKVTLNPPQTLYAHWIAEEYTITFDTAGGSAVSSITLPYGSAVTKPANPTKTGYTFEGWNPSIPDTMPAENMTIKATWKINQYTITFMDGESEIGKITDDYGKAITAPTPTKEGYTFVGWDHTVPDTMPAENIVVKAIWKVNYYTITFDTDGGSAVSSITLPYGSAVTKPADSTKTGYTFEGWNKDIPTTMPAENMTIKATWKINQYTITFDTDGGSSIESITQDYGTTVTKPANPTKDGYEFVTWDTPIPTTMPAENMTIKAIWKLKSEEMFAVSFNLDGGTGDFSAITTKTGTVTLSGKVPKKVGYEFNVWKCGEKPYAKDATITGITENMTLTAVYDAITYTVKFDANGGEGTMEPVDFDYGKSYNLPANVFTKEGFGFVHWEYTDADGNVRIFTDKQEVLNLTSEKDAKVVLKAIWNPKLEIKTDAVSKGDSFNMEISEGTVGAVTVTEQNGSERILVRGTDYELSNGTVVKVLGTCTGKLSVGDCVFRVYTADSGVAEGTVKIKSTDPPGPGPTPIPKHKVIYDTVGGPDIPTEEFAEGIVFKVADAVTKDGYTFLSWKCSDGKEYKGGETYTMGKDDVTFTAQWEKNPEPNPPEPEPQNNTAIIVGIVIGAIAVMALIGGAVYFIKKR